LCIMFRCGTDPIRSDTGACASSTGMNPILSGPVPELVHYLSVWNRSYPIRHRSLYILYPNSSDPIRPIPELIHPFPEWIRTDTEDLTPSSGMHPIRYRSLDTLSWNGSDPVRSDTRAFTPSSGMDPTRSDPIPELIHPLPEWTRPYPTRCRSLYIIFRCGADPIRSDTGACSSSIGMHPILSDPVPELLPYLSVWNRSYPIRYRGAYTSSTPTALILSDPIPELTHPFPAWI
jgi:hypothetical protein